MKNILGLILLAYASVGYAENVKLKFDSVDDVTYTKIAISNSQLSNRTIALGSYDFVQRDMNWQNRTEFSGFCVDPFQWANGSYKTYSKKDLEITDFVAPTVTNAFSAATRLANVRKLFDNAFDALAGDDIKTAGFHLALWEIFNDNMDTSSGVIQALIGPQGTNANVLSYANGLLASINGWHILNEYNVTIYKNSHYQDYVSVQPVPVPAAAWLFGSALIGFVTISNRRRV